jgi:uncharacterized coiled-coil protein SlyX
MADAQANQDQTNDEFDTLLTAIDTETNRLADEVKALADRLPASGTLDAKQTASLKARLSEHADRLRAIAADAENPVPTGPVTPAVPPAPAPDQTAADADRRQYAARRRDRNARNAHAARRGRRPATARAGRRAGDAPLVGDGADKRWG